MSKETKQVAEPVVAVPVAPVATVPVLTTKHLAAKFGMKATALRRVLRAMPEYADGVHTNYAWPSWEDAQVKRIEAAISALAKRKVEAAQAAKSALEARIAQAQAKVEAK